MGLFRKKSKTSEPTQVNEVGPSFMTEKFPETPWTVGDWIAWKKHMVDASYWEGERNHLMAAKVGMRAFVLAPVENKDSVSTDPRWGLEGIRKGYGTDAEVLPLLGEIVDWLAASGWLEPTGVKPERHSAAGLYLEAGMALIVRAEGAGRDDLVGRYRTSVVQRLRAIPEELPRSQAAELLRQRDVG